MSNRGRNVLRLDPLGLMIGLLAALEPDYEVRSNRQSGTGRPDVLITPPRKTPARKSAAKKSKR